MAFDNRQVKAQISTRSVGQQDISKLCVMLNEIIHIGGTTAYEIPLSDKDFDSHFLSGSDCIFCTAATNGETLLGFQALSLNPKLPSNWIDIATFARASPKVKGVGTALFESTKQQLNGGKFTHINATIRADNRSGLTYYTKMGFIDYHVNKAVPLSDGTPVDRISKQFEVGPQ